MAVRYHYKPKRHNSNYLRLALAAAVLILVIAAVWMNLPSATYTPSGQTTTTVPATTTTLPSTGMLAVAVKDAQHKLPGGTTVHSLYLKIGNITAHTAENESDWVTVSSDIKEVQLLDYTDVIAIIGQGVLDVGKYTQIRMYIAGGNITVTNDLLYIYTPKTYQLNVPSSELKTAHEFSIDAGNTTVLTVDFDVDNSVTKTADGYIFRPAVKVTDQQMGLGTLPANSTVIT